MIHVHTDVQVIEQEQIVTAFVIAVIAVRSMHVLTCNTHNYDQAQWHSV